MGIVKTKEELAMRAKKFTEGYTLSEVTMVNLMFSTTMEAIENVLPPPLELPSAPLGSVYVAEFHKSSFCPPYNEAAIFVSCEYKGISGSYCLSMPVTNDIAMIGGREIYGYPKKIAEQIEVTRNGDRVTGMCVRRGVPIIEIDATITEPFEDEIGSSPHFLLKTFANEKGLGPDINPRIVKQLNHVKWGTKEVGKATLSFGKSTHDPFHEIPIEQVLMALYTEGTEIQMPPGEILVEVNPKDIEPYIWIKYDWDI